MSHLKDINGIEAQLIYETLERIYPVELQNIQKKQASDVQRYGKITEATDRLMNLLLERVVADNKRLGRTRAN